MNPTSLTGVLLESLAVAGGATLLAVAAGLVVALAATVSGPRARRAWLGSGLLVLALPGFFVAGMWMERVGFSGAWRIGDGVAWARFLPSVCSALVLGLMLWPITAWWVAGAWEGLDARWLEAYPGLRGGAVVGHLLWPRARGAMGQSTAMTALLALVNFPVPALFQARVWAAEAWVDFATRFDVGSALAKSAVPAGLALLLLAVATRRPLAWPTSGGGAGALVRERLGTGLAWLAGAAAAAVVLASAGFPLMELARQPRTWTELGPAWAAAGPAAGRSVLYAAGGAALALGFGLLLARRSWGWLAACGWAWPGILVGLGWLKIGEWTAPAGFRDTPWIVLGALGTRYAFLGWLAARRAWNEADPRLRDWVTLQGGGRWALWRNVVWPSGAGTLTAAAWILYVLCLWDVDALILVVPPGGDSLGTMIFNLLHYGHNAQVSALSVLLAVLAVLPWFGIAAIRRWGRPSGPATTRAAAGVLVAASAIGWNGCSPGGSDAAVSEVRLDSALFERVLVIGSKGTGPGQFVKPRSVAVDDAGHVYAVDMTGRVQRFGTDGRWQALWQMPETKKGKAKGMAGAPGGGVLVVEPHYHRVNRYDPDGRLLAQWGTQGTNTGRLGFPRAIAPGRAGDCYVAEYGVVERVQRFAADGREFRGSFGTGGTGPGQLNRAEGLGVGPEGHVHVADSCNHRVQVFDAEGRWIRSHGRAGQAVGEFSYPYDVRVDEAGRQYVCEFGNSRVQILDAQDRPLEVLGGPGSAPGRMNNPWSLCLDGQGNLYVADSLNHRLLKFVRRGT